MNEGDRKLKISSQRKNWKPGKMLQTDARKITRKKASTLTGKFACRGSARVNKTFYGEEGITRRQGRDHYPEQDVFIQIKGN